MARFSEDELDEIRRNTDIVALIESYGTKLKQRPDGNEYIGLCPLHEDKEPSLNVNRAKGVWHCKAGCSGGDCIAWVMKAEKVSFVGAVELLKNNAVGLMAGNGTKAKYVPRLPNPIVQSASDQELIYQVAEYYQTRLAGNEDAIAYLTRRGLNHAEAIATFNIGFCDRTLGHRIPKRETKAGAEQRERLDALGILKDTGHESMRGCITFPILLGEGKAGELYGRRITKGTPENERHWYLKGPHVGIWNAAAFQSIDTIILCEGIIDALTFWIAGFRNVTSTFGKSGFTDEIYQAFIKSDTKRCYISFDNDSKNDPTDNAAMLVANKLMAQGIECFRLQFPLNANDANAYAMKLKDGNGSAHGPLQMLINQAVWLGKSSNKTGLILPASAMSENTAPKQESPSEPQCASTGLAVPSQPESSAIDSEPIASSLKPRAWKNIPPACELFEQAEKRVADRLAQEQAMQSAPKRENPPSFNSDQPAATTSQAIVNGPDNLSLLGAKTLAPLASDSAGQTTVPAKMPSLEVELKDNEVHITIGNRSYRVRGLSKSSNTFDTMKINVLVRKGEVFFVDTIDLYSAKNRNAFIKESSRELALEEEIIKRDLGKVLLKLEELQDQQALENIAATKTIEISDVDKAKALALLQSPDLLDQILSDFDACGVIGEQTNKLFGYIAATSRKLDKPLAMMVQSSSAAGKSSLMEAVLGFMPPEEQISYSAMTGQSLFYMGESNLKNKILAISEEEGIRQAAYALKILQSEGELNIASTGKDPGTGRMETQNYHVEGPVMIFLTTTAIDVDIELMNRCTVLSVNEEREQTESIHKQQRKEETFEGFQSHYLKVGIRQLHHNAQRLLRPLGVVNDFAEKLRFMDSQTRFRRDHKKYLTLIRAIALLHQYQREIKTTLIDGKSVEYIEVTLQDIRIANGLADSILGKSIDDLPAPSRRLLKQLFEMVVKEAETQAIESSEVRFTRRQMRERLGWSATPLAIHIEHLVNMEYLVSHSGGKGKTIQYELFYDGRGREGQPTLCGLIDPSQFDANTINDASEAPNLTQKEANLTQDSSNLTHSKLSQNLDLTHGVELDSPNENMDQGDMNGKT